MKFVLSIECCHASEIVCNHTSLRISNRTEHFCLCIAAIFLNAYFEGSWSFHSSKTTHLESWMILLSWRSTAENARECRWRARKVSWARIESSSEISDTFRSPKSLSLLNTLYKSSCFSSFFSPPFCFLLLPLLTCSFPSIPNSAYFHFKQRRSRQHDL